jgi:hypothetical protein
MEVLFFRLRICILYIKLKLCFERQVVINLHTV